MKMTYYRLVVFIAGMLISCSILADARTDINFTRTPYIDEELKLHVEVDLLNRSHFPVQDVRIYYREYSEPRFQSARMAMEGLRYLASVNLSDYKGSMVEYFVNVEYADGSFQSYPAEAPESNLMKVSVAQDFDSGDGILVISPEPGEDILTDEFILTVSFFQYSASVDGERTKLYLDDWDVSRYVKVFDDFLTFAPKRVPQGSHAIRLELYDKTGRLLARKKWSFSAYQRRGPAPTAPRDQLNINGQLYAESRTEELVDGAVSNQYTRTGLRLNAAYQDFSFGTRLFLSNQEDENLQPINRYSGWAQYNFWTDRFIKVTGGDAYPQLNPFLLSNIFIRGVYGQVYLKFLNIDAVTGQTRRGIEGSQTITGPDTSIIAGAFERDIWGIRTSFGGRKNFQFGIMAMKGRDDPNSIQFGREPEENLGVGTDLYIAGDHNRIILEGSVNLSSYNPNILDGKDTPFDSLEKISDDLDRDFYDLAADLITVNQYLIPLPGIAYQAQLRLRYFNNNLSILYKSVEDEFHSLGQPFLLRDNRGLAITDNIRFFNNQIFLNLRYQQYENNLNDTKPATTTNRTMAFNISYFPMQNLPSFTLGLNNYNRDNDVAENTSSLAVPEDNNTNTINFSTSYSFLFRNLNNRLTLNLLNYDRQDNISTGVDNLANTASLILQTRYNIPLKTNLEFNFQQNENKLQTTESDFSVSSFGGGAEYSFNQLFNRMDELTLSVNGRYGLVDTEQRFDPTPALNSKTDFNRTFLNGRLIYAYPPYGRLSVNGDLITYSGDRDFQDYIITARYDVSF